MNRGKRVLAEPDRMLMAVALSCRRSLKVDRHLLVKGTNDIFALGDASTIEQV